MITASILHQQKIQFQSEAVPSVNRALHHLHLNSLQLVPVICPTCLYSIHLTDTWLGVRPSLPPCQRQRITPLPMSTRAYGRDGRHCSMLRSSRADTKDDIKISKDTTLFMTTHTTMAMTKHSNNHMT